jgi:response regulator RpfG family c-di-GMP phosphodiesterase
VEEPTPGAAEIRARVLIVDDEQGPRESLRMILSPSYEVLCARDGIEALEVLQTAPVDVVTLDLNMPGIKGDELMHRLRSRFPAVEVIVITGARERRQRVEAPPTASADYIQKPFDVVKVLSAVSRGLGSRQGRQQLTAFLQRLGQLVGRAEDVDRILGQIERSPRMQQRVESLLSVLEDGRPAEEGERVRRATFLEVLAETIECQHDFMRGHAQRTSFYAGLLCDRLCLSARDHEHVRMAGFLHDVGKVGVPSELLARPGALDPQERRLVERHPVIGVGLVDPLGLASDVSRWRSATTTSTGTGTATRAGGRANRFRSGRASSPSRTRSTR